MSLRHRRRLLSDEVESDEQDASIRIAGRTADGAAAYAPAAKAARERALHSLFPARWWAISLTFVAGLLAIAGCVGLEFAVPRLEAMAAEVDWSCLQLAADGGLSRWLASTLLAACGATALFLYALRRHRIDDYHGRYRVWVWIAGVCLLASLAESTGLGKLLRGLMATAAGASNLESRVAVPSAAALVCAAVGVRLVFEIRASRAAVAALLLAALAVGGAVLCGPLWPAEWDAASGVIVARTSGLAGYLLVLVTFLAYGRHVQLAIDGKLLVKAARPKRVKTRPEAKSSERQAPLRLRTDLDPPEPPKPTPAPAAKTTPQPEPVTSTTNRQAPLERHLSRAERRKMRRMAS